MLLVIQWLENILWWLSKIVYKLIPDVYAVFEFFAKQKFFTMGELANFWNNLYIVMSVLVLFAIGIKLISAIVNPDVLDGGPKDAKKKNAKRTFFDAIIAVFLIILVPMVFSMLNSLQTEIIESKFIQKYIFGISFTAESQTNVGQVLAYQTISSFMYPCDVETEPKCKPPADEPEKGKYQMNALSWDIKNIDAYIPAEDLISDQWGDGNVSDNTLRYHYVLGLAAGILVLYQIILLALDMALRAAKIGMLELMLPIILGAFIFNRDILTKWIKEFIATYLSAFLKLMAVTMMVLGLSRINILFESFEKDITFVDGAVAKGLLRLILLMGILRLVKEIPNIINKIFGTNIQYQGGLRGRLGQMAGVGGLAQRAWDTLRTHPIQTARRLVAAPLSAVGGAVSHGAAAFSRGRQQWQNGQRGAAIRTGIGGFFGLGGAAARAGRQGWQNGNLQGIGGAYRRYEDLHPTNSNYLGTLGERIRMGAGFRSSIEQEAENDTMVNFRDRAGVTQRRVTTEQLQREQTQMNEALARRDAIFNAAEKEVERADSNVRINFTSGAHTFDGSYAQIKEKIDNMKANGGISDNDAADALRQLELERQDAIHDVCTTVLSGATSMTGARILAGTLGDIHGPTIGTIVTNRDVMNQSLADLITGANLVDNAGVRLGITDINNWANLDALNISLWRNTNDINYNLQLHQQEIANRNNTAEHVTREANVSAANAHRNNGGGGGNAGGHH